MKDHITIGSREIGESCPCFIIAEAGVNHNGDVRTARKLIDAAAVAKADAVKFQTFGAGDIALETAEKARYQLETTGEEGTQRRMLEELELPPSAYSTLREHADRRGLVFLSSPFDPGSVDLLEGIGVPAYKVPSGELTNLPLLRYIAATGKPVILSTGMGTLAEIEAALTSLRLGGTPGVALLHAVSSYPAAAADLNLRAMETLRQAFHLPVGYSDHTLGIWAPVAAVALGASIIEKHLTLDRSMKGPDHRASLEPPEFRGMVDGIRDTEAALGDGIKRPTPPEMEMRRVVRKSLVAAADISRGTVIAPGMITAKRPGTGISPVHLDLIAGRKALRRIRKDEMISWDMVE